MRRGVMQRLREETAERHRSTERRPLVRAMLRGELSDAAFQWKLWGYRELHGLATRQVSHRAAASSLLAQLLEVVETREKHLEADLEVTCAPVPWGLRHWRETLRPPTRLEEALGWLYVLEGSSLGAQVLLERLSARYPAHLLHYYRGHEHETAQHWETFSALMNELVEDAQLCVDGAEACFEAVAQLFDAIERGQNPASAC